MQIFGKNFSFTHYTFEMVITLGSMAVAMVLGAIKYPKDVPVSILQFMAMIGLLGFVTGFTVSNLCIWLYKELTKNRK